MQHLPQKERRRHFTEGYGDVPGRTRHRALRTHLAPTSQGKNAELESSPTKISPSASRYIRCPCHTFPVHELQRMQVERAS